MVNVDMKWKKKGLIFSKDIIDLPWYKKYTLVPVPYLIDDTCLRIYVTMCDSLNVGRIGYVDVNPDNPSEIIGFNKTPIVDIGIDGHFDDNGVVTSSILKDGQKIYLYYSGYQSCVKVPYMIYSGVAVSHDNGASFKKITDQVPMLDRIDGESGTRCAPYVIKEDVYKMWYTSDHDVGWVQKENKKFPLYDLKYLSSTSPIKWPRQSGTTSVELNNNDEHGIAKCTVWKEDGLYKAIYSIRSFSKKYRLGYAESNDGIHFARHDNKIGIDVSNTGWDSEMIAFAERIEVSDKTYLFYCGNNYGLGGVGYAELIK